MLTVSLNEDAARSAYLVGFHAAQALIFERRRKLLKTHNGVQAEFFLLTKNDLDLDDDLRRFLSRAYEYKAEADYFVTDDYVMSGERAAAALGIAERLLAYVLSLLTPPNEAPRS